MYWYQCLWMQIYIFIYLYEERRRERERERKKKKKKKKKGEKTYIKKTSSGEADYTYITLILQIGHLHYPNTVDRSLNETVTDKVRKYRVDYNNNPPNVISFMTTIASTSGRLHSDFV